MCLFTIEIGLNLFLNVKTTITSLYLIKFSHIVAHHCLHNIYFLNQKIHFIIFFVVFFFIKVKRVSFSHMYFHFRCDSLCSRNFLFRLNFFMHDNQNKNKQNENKNKKLCEKEKRKLHSLLRPFHSHKHNFFCFLFIFVIEKDKSFSFFFSLLLLAKKNSLTSGFLFFLLPRKREFRFESSYFCQCFSFLNQCNQIDSVKYFICDFPFL